MYLAEKGYQVTGIDVSEGLISEARERAIQRILDIAFMVTPVIDISFGDDEFDIIVGFKVLCYIPTRQLRHDFLQELYRMLKPGGTFILTQNIVPEEHIDEAQDEHFHTSPASILVF